MDKFNLVVLQEIRYSKRNNSPYITMFGKRLYLTNFMRNDYGRR